MAAFDLCPKLVGSSKAALELHVRALREIWSQVVSELGSAAFLLGWGEPSSGRTELSQAAADRRKPSSGHSGDSHCKIFRQSGDKIKTQLVNCYFLPAFPGH